MLLAVTNDLMAAAPVEAAARQAQLPCQVVSADRLSTIAGAVPIRVVVLDLAACDNVAGTVDAIRSLVPADVPIVAFGPHVHVEKLQAATAAGCQPVVTRGQFHQRGGAIVAAALESPA